MNLHINGINIDITDALKDYIKTKLERIQRHSENVITANITLSVDKLNHTAAADWHIAGKTLHITESSKDMYQAIDLLMDKLDRAVLKHKEKTHDHRAAATGRIGLD